MPVEKVWKKIHDIIQETVNIQQWETNDLQCNQQEQLIKDAWNLTIKPTLINKVTHQNSQSPDSWNTPPTSFIKLNFDDASKGNPGSTGRGGFFRNNKGEILYIYSSNLGYTINNVAELNALVEGLKIAIGNNYQKVILEGDAEIIISMCKKLINDMPPNKVSHS